MRNFTGKPNILLSQLSALGYMGGRECDAGTQVDIREMGYRTPITGNCVFSFTGTTTFPYLGSDWLISKDPDSPKLVIHHICWLRRVISWAGPIEDILGL